MELATSITTQETARPIAGATFFPRAMAQIIDLVVHNVVLGATALINGFLIGVLALLLGQPATHFTTKLQGHTIIFGICALLGYTMYHTICEWLNGATLGKLILRIYVRQEDGSPCRPGPAFIRSLALLLDSLFLGLIAALSMRSSDLKQRLGDQWAHTVVVERSRANLDQRPSGWQFLLVFLLAIMVDMGLYAALLWAVVLF